MERSAPDNREIIFRLINAEIAKGKYKQAPQVSGRLVRAVAAELPLARSRSWIAPECPKSHRRRFLY